MYKNAILVIPFIKQPDIGNEESIVKPELIVLSRGQASCHYMKAVQVERSIGKFHQPTKTIDLLQLWAAQELCGHHEADLELIEDEVSTGQKAC